MVDKTVLTGKSIMNRVDKMSSRVVSRQRGVPYDEEKLPKDHVSKIVLEQISQRTQDEMIASETIMQLNPDTKRAMSILTGLIVCPNGGQRVQLNFKLGALNDYQDDENGNLRKVLDVIANHFKHDFDIQPTQFDKVYRMLTVSGAECYGIIPDSTVDVIINGQETEVGLESLYKHNVIQSKEFLNGTLSFKPCGFLGNPSTGGKTPGLEAALNRSPHRNLTYNDTVNLSDKNKAILRIIDNPDILKIPLILENNNRKRSSVALERYRGKSTPANSKVKLHANYSKRRNYKVNPVVAIANPSKFDAVGRPQVISFPAESVIPVFYPGDPTNRFGAFILLDKNGNPLHRPTDTDSYRDLTKMAGQGNDDQMGSNQLLGKMKNSLSNIKAFQDKAPEEDLIKHFANFIEREFKTRLENGSYANTFDIGLDEVISRVMLSRVLAQQETYALFIPDDLLSYQAFDFNELGVGISLISTTKLMGTIRSVLFFANFMGELSNVVRQKELRVQLDERDPRPTKTLETIINEVVLKLNGGNGIFNFSGPSDIITNLQRYALSVKLENMDVPGMPKMNVELEEKKRDVQPVDTTFMDLVKKYHMMDFGLSPEIVDQSFQPQFAAQILRDNDITARVVSKYVGLLAECNKDFIRKYTYQDEELIKDCINVITLPKKKKVNEDGDEEQIINMAEGGDNARHFEIIEEVLNVMVVSTPEPDQNELQTTFENVDNFTKIIDRVVDAIFGDTLRNTLDGDGAKYSMLLSEQLKSNLLKDFLRSNNGIPNFIAKALDMESLEEVLNGEIDGMVEFLKITKTAVERLREMDLVITEEGKDLETDITGKYDKKRADKAAQEAETATPPETPPVETPPETTPEEETPPETPPGEEETPPEETPGGEGEGEFELPGELELPEE